jgi:hypothetical protein
MDGCPAVVSASSDVRILTQLRDPEWLNGSDH